MTLGKHLRELRRRVTVAAASILVAAVAGFFLSELVIDVLRGPIAAIAESRNASLNFDSVTGAFDLRIQIALYLGVLLACPVWLYEVFAFLTPAMTGKEKRYTFGFFFSAVPLFLAGCAAGFFVFPHVVTLLAGFASEQDSSIFQAKYYFDFAMKLVLAVGVAFVMPVFVVLLNFMGIITGRQILASWRWAVLVITVFCAVATPAADVFSMFLLALPMVFLYFVAVGIAFIRDRSVERARRKFLTEPADAAAAAPTIAP